MIDKKLQNLLFIAPDSLPPGISRSYWLANGLSRFFNVYYVQWEDSRSYKWEKEKAIFYKNNRYSASLFSFFKSLIPRIKIYREQKFNAKNLFFTFLPVMQKNAISHFTGEILARKVSRSFNKKSFERLLKNVNFSYIFHAENMMLSPIISTKIPAFFDMQDDFDESQDSPQLMAYEKEYLQQNAPLCKKRFAINQPTAEHMQKLAECNFEILPNGADFSVFNPINLEKAMALRTELGLSNKLLLTYIGSKSHIDTSFTGALARAALQKHPGVHFLLVGDLPEIISPNVTMAGLIDPAIVHLYYMMADVGIMPHAADNAFIKNCAPLKVIQFSAAKKPIVTPLLESFISNPAGNVYPVEFKPERWLDKVLSLQNFVWSEQMQVFWANYSWSNITKNLADMIRKER